MGTPGVGKSYLARKLSEKTGIYFFDRDGYV
jgi:adenylate kinase family enzyme